MEKLGVSTGRGYPRNPHGWGCGDQSCQGCALFLRNNSSSPGRAPGLHGRRMPTEHGRLLRRNISTPHGVDVADRAQSRLSQCRLSNRVRRDDSPNTVDCSLMPPRLVRPYSREPCSECLAVKVRKKARQGARMQCPLPCNDYKTYVLICQIGHFYLGLTE